MNFSLIHIVWTILLLAIFVGIVLWAWSGRNKKRFDAAARAPFDEEIHTNSPSPLEGEGKGRGGPYATPLPQSLSRKGRGKQGRGIVHG
jgi:cytochrome c oxidase cbb3-type subunit 4